MRKQEFESLGRLVGGVELKELAFGAGAPDVGRILTLLGLG
jgi:hypothetical protein